ncbi:hypothetical protein [Massilia aerilata]|uniref:Uncharacterized protein n=1 Tax=Massilia aerilata TaxID=453817 RepID=A0ABW0RR29_9BURK
MITSETTELLYKESAGNLGLLSPISTLIFCLSGIVSAPLYFVFKKLLSTDFVLQAYTGFVQAFHGNNEAIDVDLFQFLMAMLALYASLGGVDDFIQKRVIPFVCDLMEQDPFHVKSVKDISASESAVFEAVIKKSTLGFKFMQIAFHGADTSLWIYKYNFFLKWAYLLLSFFIVAALLRFFIA